MKQLRKILAALLVAALCLSAAGALADGLVWTTGKVNMRKGPGLGYSSMRSIQEGVRLAFDKTEKDERGVTWYRIVYKGRTGWISSRYATENSASGATGSKSKSSSGKLVTTGKVHLRTGAGLDYKALRSVPKGVTLNYDELKKDDRGVYWCHVSYKGKSGWISSKYAQKK